MAFWKFVTVAVVGGFIHKAWKNDKEDTQKNAEEEYRRVNTPCDFQDGISETEFALIAKKAGKHIRRLSHISVDGPIVYGTVRAQSGISEWSFKIDFNDYGHITGIYWLSSDNYDSSIPKHVADDISVAIQSFLNDIKDSFEDELNEEENKESNTYFNQRSAAYCPYCGQKVRASGANFCAYCGKHISI